MKRTLLITTVLLFAVIAGLFAQTSFTGDITRKSAANVTELSNYMLSQARDYFAGSNARELWIGYQVPVREKFRNMHVRHYSHGLNSHGIITDFRDDYESSSKCILYGFTDTSNGPSLSRVKILDPDERARFTFRLVWLEDVKQAASTTMLTNYLNNSAHSRVHDDLISALIIHTGEAPIRTLKAYVLSGADEDDREEAFTLLAIALVPDRYSEVWDLSKKVKGSDVREQIPFACFLARTDEAIQDMLQLARNDHDEDVREQAAFWLGNLANKKMAEAEGLGDSWDEDEDDDAHLVSIIGIMDSEKSRKALMRLAKTGKTFKVRKAAIFWLAQEPDEEVLNLLESILL